MIMLIGYLAVLNIMGFLAMGVDKSRACHHKWRIPEKTLFAIALLGGSLGSWMGMYTFRHKTKHWYFVMGMPIIFVIEVIVFMFLLDKHILG